MDRQTAKSKAAGLLEYAKAHNTRLFVGFSTVVGQTIKALREEQGINQTMLARRADMTQGSLSRAESASSVIDVDQIFIIAKALGVPTREILTRADAAVECLERDGIMVCRKGVWPEGKVMAADQDVPGLLELHHS